MPLNGKISPHRLLYPMHSPLLSFNPLPSPAPLIFPLRHAFPSSFRSLLLQSSLSFLILRFSSPLHLSEYSLNFYPPSTPFLSLSLFLLSSSRVLVLNTPEPGHGSLGVQGASYIT